MAGKPWKRPSSNTLRLLHAQTVAMAVSPTEAADRAGCCLKTLRRWWEDEGLQAPRRIRQHHRQAIMRRVLETHPDARRSKLVASVREVYPKTSTRTVYTDQVRMGIPTQHQRRRAEVSRLILEHSPASGVEIHAVMKARGWSAGVCVVRAIMRELREGGTVEHYQRQTAERALIVNQRHTLIRQLLDEHPDATDGELSELMAAKGCPAAEKTVGHDRRTMGIDAVYTRKLAEVRYYAVTWPSLTAEEIRASMSNDGWRLNLRSVARLLAKVREETAAQAA